MACKVVAIIQARMASSRLPGKVLLDIAGEPMLGRVVRRTSRALRVQATVVATTSDPSDDAVAAFCEAQGIGYARGSREFLAAYSTYEGLIGQRLDLTGAPIGARFRICPAGDNDGEVSITYNSLTDEFYLAWMRESNSDGTFSILGGVQKSGIEGRRIDNPLFIAGPVFDIAYHVPEVQFSPVTNSYLVIWDRNIRGQHSVPSQFVNGTNTLLGGINTVSMSGSYDGLGLARNQVTDTYVAS